MVMWVFGYGSLIWKPGFNYDDHLVGFIKGYRRVFYQGSTDHRGTPEFPGRTVTLEPAEGEVCWGIAYKITKKEDQEVALTYLEVREKQYDKKAYVDLFTEPAASEPAVSGVLVYIGSPDKKVNENYLGPASVEEIASLGKHLSVHGTSSPWQLKPVAQRVLEAMKSWRRNFPPSMPLFKLHLSHGLGKDQIVRAKGPSGPNRDYLFQLEKSLGLLGCEDKHVSDIAKEARRILSEVTIS